MTSGRGRYIDTRAARAGARYAAKKGLLIYIAGRAVVYILCLF